MLPARGASNHIICGVDITYISIHAPREGSITQSRPTPNWPISNFNPCSPRGEHRLAAAALGGGFFISIHAPREGSIPLGPEKHPCRAAISIHAPHEGSIKAETIPHVKLEISIHAPREGSILDLRCSVHYVSSYFNPCPPRGEHRATCCISTGSSPNFNPCPPRGEHPASCACTTASSMISIHAPREGSIPND